MWLMLMRPLWVHDCSPSNSTNLHGTSNLAMLKLSIWTTYTACVTVHRYIIRYMGKTYGSQEMFRGKGRPRYEVVKNANTRRLVHDDRNWKSDFLRLMFWLVYTYIIFTHIYIHHDFIHFQVVNPRFWLIIYIHHSECDTLWWDPTPGCSKYVAILLVTGWILGEIPDQTKWYQGQTSHKN